MAKLMRAMRFRFKPIWTATVLGLQFGIPAQAQGPGQSPLFPLAAQRRPLIDFDSASPLRETAPGGTARLRLFGMPTGFLRDPTDLDNDDPSPAQNFTDKTGAEDEPAGFLVALGTYNPYFDMRRPDDPRGLGYYKFHSQMQVLDLGRTN